MINLESTSNLKNIKLMDFNVLFCVFERVRIDFNRIVGEF